MSERGTCSLGGSLHPRDGSCVNWRAESQPQQDGEISLETARERAAAVFMKHHLKPLETMWELAGDLLLAESRLSQAREALQWWMDYDGDNLDCEFRPICEAALAAIQPTNDETPAKD